MDELISLTLLVLLFISGMTAFAVYFFMRTVVQGASRRRRTSVMFGLPPAAGLTGVGARVPNNPPVKGSAIRLEKSRGIM